MYQCKENCPVTYGNTCCYSCNQKEGCLQFCPDTPATCGRSVEIPDEVAEETALATFQTEQVTVIQNMISLLEQKKALEEREKTMKDQLKTAMERHGIKAFKTDEISIAYVEETTATSIDSAKIKKKYPQIFEECQKTSRRSAYVKITIKGGA